MAEQNVAIGKLEENKIITRSDFMPLAHRPRNDHLAFAGDGCRHGVRMSYNRTLSSELARL